jgi:hypothetical protein
MAGTGHYKKETGIEHSALPTMKKPCMKAPPGWKCTRVGGHEGPCAAIEWPPVGPVSATDLRGYYVITATCSAGHMQETKIDAGLGRGWAEALAGLVDGSSPMYVHKPDEKSVIGKCATCGLPFTCVVE